MHKYRAPFYYKYRSVVPAGESDFWRDVDFCIAFQIETTRDYGR